MNDAARAHQGLTFRCEKQSATGSRGMVVTNHPLASAAGAEVLLAGGNAVDAAVTALFALTVVEPMMVGVLGGGMAHIRLAEGGRHVVLDGISTAPARARPDMYETLSDTLPDYQETQHRANAVGPLAVAVPGALLGWCTALERFGTIALADAVAPAIRLAERGFVTTPYLHDCAADCAADLARDAGLTRLFLPDNAPIPAGSRLVQPEYAETLRLIARDGAGALYGGPLGQALAWYMAGSGGLIEEADLLAYRVIEREPIRGRYRGYEIIGPPPPSSAGVHVAQMLNILEAYDLRGLGFGSADGVHLLAEALKIGFADRAAATADPAFVRVPVERLTAKSYADERRARIRMDRAQAWSAGVAAANVDPSDITPVESSDTTHVTVADAQGNVVAATQTINALFGARVQVPGTGMIANNYMFNFDPHPGHALSVAPGKRVFTSMAPMMALREDGRRLAYALGLPGGLRIFGSAMQALMNLIDHGMTLQQAVEAPRVWTQGGVLELEQAYPDEVLDDLVARGHQVSRVPRIAGGMNAIAFRPDGTMEGAACWRADGTPVAIAGGLARAGVRFTI